MWKVPLCFPEISSTRSPSQYGTSFKKRGKGEQRFQAYTQAVIKFLVVGKKRFSSILLENQFRNIWHLF